MAMIREIPVKCPGCGKVGSATSYASLNVSLDPSLKDRLMSGELLQWQCEGCGVRCLNADPILYHDMAQKVLIQWMAVQYAPTIESLATALPPAAAFRQFGAGYRLRVVRELEDLVEKIRIFDAGFDDRAVEWLKCDLYRMVTEKRPDGASSDGTVEFVQARFQRCLEVEGERKMEFRGPLVMRLPGFPPLPMSVMPSESSYQRALQHLDAHLPWPEPVAGNFLLVDQGYVERAWSKLPVIREPIDPHPPASQAAPPKSKVADKQANKSWWRPW